MAAGPRVESGPASGVRKPPASTRPRNRAHHDVELRPGRDRDVAAVAPPALREEREGAWRGPGREDRRQHGRVRLDRALPRRRGRRTDSRPRARAGRDAARADRGAGDRARAPDRSAAPGVPDCGQQADGTRHLGRGAAVGGTERPAGRRLRPVAGRVFRWRTRQAAGLRSRRWRRGRGRRGLRAAGDHPRTPNAIRRRGRAISGSSATIGCSAATAPALPMCAA